MSLRTKFPQVTQLLKRAIGLGIIAPDMGKSLEVTLYEKRAKLNLVDCGNWNMACIFFALVDILVDEYSLTSDEADSIIYLLSTQGN